MFPQRIVIIIASIIGLIILSGVGFVLYQKSQTPVPSTALQTNLEVQVTSLPTSVPEDERRSFKDLTLAKGNQQCTFQDADTGNSGTIFVSSGKTRGDLVSKTGDTSINSHMISDGSTVYIWMSGNNTGLKTSFDKVDQAGGNQKTFDINKQIDYKCSGWSQDNSKFTLPQDIKFTDLGNLIPSGLPKVSISGTQGNSSACAVCNNLTGDSKTQCLTALKCD